MHLFQTVVVLLFFQPIYCQKRKVENLRKYEKRKLNFGFHLGINHSCFIIQQEESPTRSFSTLESPSKPGLSFGGISEFRLHDYITLRLLISMTIADRHLVYGSLFRDNPTFTVQRIESNYLGFPLNIKYRSRRLNNFGVYLIGGGNLAVDLATKKKVHRELGKIDFHIEGGFGLDFYLPYFKFAIEGKLSRGITNSLAKESQLYSEGVHKLYPRMFLVSFIFEGKEGL